MPVHKCVEGSASSIRTMPWQSSRSIGQRDEAARASSGVSAASRGRRGGQRHQFKLAGALFDRAQELLLPAIALVVEIPGH